MSSSAAIEKDFKPAGGLLNILGSAELIQLDERLRDRIELGKLRKQADDDRRELQASVGWLVEHLGEPAPDDMDSDSLAELAREAHEKEREVAAHFVPVIARLRSSLTIPRTEFDADIRRLLQDGIEVLEGWLVFYRELYTMLARQAEERIRSGKVLRARTVEGEIDHAALSLEFIERFPNIRAALAK
jgi:hypothetical protein